VIRSKGSYCILQYLDDPAARRSCPFIGTISRPECFVRYCARPASAGARFLIFSEQLPGRFVEAVRRLADASCAAGSNTPSQPSPIKGEDSKDRRPLYRIAALAVVATRVVRRKKSSPLDGGGFGWG
jgi:hypothetical protein